MKKNNKLQTLLKSAIVLSLIHLSAFKVLALEEMSDKEMRATHVGMQSQMDMHSLKMIKNKLKNMSKEELKELELKYNQNMKQTLKVEDANWFNINQLLSQLERNHVTLQERMQLNILQDLLK